MTRIPDPETVAALLREALTRGTQPRLRVTSDSMAPTLRPGDQVSIETVRPDGLRLGDILVIEREGDLLTHRLVAIHSDHCHTKGDQDAILDPPTPLESILGRIAFIEGGYRRIDLKKRLWWMVNLILGQLGWRETQLYQITPIARLPIRLITRIILCILSSRIFSLNHHKPSQG